MPQAVSKNEENHRLCKNELYFSNKILFLTAINLKNAEIVDNLHFKIRKKALIFKGYEYLPVRKKN